MTISDYLNKFENEEKNIAIKALMNKYKISFYEAHKHYKTWRYEYINGAINIKYKQYKNSAVYHKIPMKVKIKMLKLKEEGKTLKDLGEIYGCSIFAISHHINLAKKYLLNH